MTDKNILFSSDAPLSQKQTFSYMTSSALPNTCGIFNNVNNKGVLSLWYLFNIVNQAIDFVLKSEANLKISAVDTCLKIEVTSEDSTAFSSIVQLSKWSEAAVEEN